LNRFVASGIVLNKFNVLHGQAVENMLRLIFLKEEEVHVFKDIDIIHGKVGHRAMRSWGCQL